MRRLIFAAILAAAAIAVSLSFGSSHREAPLTALDPTADNTDVYAFTAPDRPGDLTVVANWIPFEDPAGGPNFYKLDPAARYYVKGDNTHAFVLQVPEAKVTRNHRAVSGPSARNAVVGVWASTERRTVRVLRGGRARAHWV